MTISIQKRIEAMENQANFDDILKARDMALELIWQMVETPEWTLFVKNFVDSNNAEQLLRLTLKDSKATDVAVRQTVCYLLANVVCGGGTGKRLHENIDGILDDDLSYDEKLPTREEQREISARVFEAAIAAEQPK